MVFNSIQNINIDEIIKGQFHYKIKDPNYFDFKLPRREFENNLKNKISSKKFQFKHKQSLKKLPKKINEILLISDIRNYNEKIEGKLYSKFIDPYIDTMEGEFSKLLITNNSLNKEMSFVNENIDFNADGFISYFWVNKRDQLIKKLDKEVGLLELDSHINKEYLLKSLYNVFLYANLFWDILNKLKPRRVAFPCFYHEFNFGLILAAKSLNIETIDIQHGIISEGHVAYSNFRKNNKTDMIPDTFWVWGDYFKNYLQKVLPDIHEVNITGNLWPVLVKQKYASFFNSLKFDSEFLNRFQSICLFSHQVGIHETYQMEYLKNLAVKFKKSLFLLRLHPREKKEISFYEKLFKDFMNVEVEVATRSSLFYVLEQSNYVFTMWSTVAIEALSYGGQVYLIHEKAKDIYPELIQSGIFKLVIEPDSIENLKIQTKSFNSENAHQFIISDICKVKENLGFD